MRALIMAGGAGSRLNRGEKPLILVNNRPMLAYVIDAFAGAECNVVVATSPKTPMTRNWCRVNGIDSYNAEGVDYILDMVESVQALDETQPLFVSVSDIPCIDAGIIADVRMAYGCSGKEACSTWVPARIVKACRGGMTYHETIQNEEVCPTGLNILCGCRIAEVQDELQLVINDPRLALNVNTRTDLVAAETFLNECSGNP
ncbi:MAG: NTP transferase domain-containing protein [Methanoregula sp.]|jgi:adenosylcobinamide-phosphate guanylyltransferase